MVLLIQVCESHGRFGHSDTPFYTHTIYVQALPTSYSSVLLVLGPDQKRERSWLAVKCLYHSCITGTGYIRTGGHDNRGSKTCFSILGVYFPREEESRVLDRGSKLNTCKKKLCDIFRDYSRVNPCKPFSVLPSRAPDPVVRVRPALSHSKPLFNVSVNAEFIT